MRYSRLLLLIALFAPAFAWNLNNLFSNTEVNNGEIYLHPLSPKEASPERIKRQAYQVYVGGDTSVSVDKGGQQDTGVWGQWTKDRECSRTCGGGVLIEKRQCNGQCSGPSVRYVSCNIDPCESGSKDFRAEQCSKHNDDPLDGNYYKWLPYTGKNKCELNCKPDTANFYFKFADKVIDGTKCDHSSDDICVEGVCLPLGCDGKLGSAKKSDKCGVCGGDGSTCKTVDGIFDERNLSPGYHNIILLPAGATAIKIEEMRPTLNSLALKNSSDYFFLNGNYQIEVLDKDVEVAGTRFKYEKQKTDTTERLTAKGPLDEEVTVALLFQRGGGSKDSAIKYEFSVPIEQDVPYLYKPGEWSSCSVTCGKGVQTRTPYCVDTSNQNRVTDDLCDENNSTKPEVEKPCETVDCEAEWYEGEWEECSQTCGNQGFQYRVVYCHKVYKDGRRMTVDDDNCTSSRPEVKQSCNRFHCPEWQAGPWSACSDKCGDAKQYRSVTCRSEKEGEEGKLLAADKCNETEKISAERDCNLGPCEGLTFFTSEWKLCEKCNDTEETRNVTCKDKTGRQYQLEKCLNENTTSVPIDTRSCATVQPCNYEWHASEWSKCSTECGHGHKTRRVNCAIAELGQIKVVDEGLCQAEKPETKTNCTNEEKCTGTYFSSPWTNCSEKCGGGTQSRFVVCLNYDRQPVPEWCDESEKPDEQQECNVDPCPTCFESDFGCCPDNVTFAQGDFYEGCSNCSISDFGCCNDNITEATGPNKQGCPEYVEVEGSGEEDKAAATAETSEECEVTNEQTGETVKISCAEAAGNATVDALDLFLSNDTDGNATIHCSKTEFGCCPDWYTPAEGPNKEGCPEFVMGACNETQYGCCLDEVTLARGPNLEGCGEPSCAASLYGCCKDRKTIAFGPHYAGCERSSFPCELSQFGCCPDGETAALGKNNTGCGANCLVTKYGCCPDGVTVSKGLSNEGCGCEFAQFGCCPDGKSAAKGASFYGCPNTCAQSQYGCCPDGKTAARGSNKEGCPCQYTRYGCCPDGETTALGPNEDGCDDCRYAKYGCCPDGESKALGSEYQGCPSTTLAPFLLGGTVAPSKIIACSQPQDQGNVCHVGYKLVWFYDASEGRCSQFWYGGCGGNENRFATKEMCETICVEPPNTGRCYLPKVEGPQRCNQLVARYWYDYSTKQCAAFWWRGCQGNANNFDTWESCQTFCSNVGPIDVQPPTTPAPAPGQLPYVYQPTNAPEYAVENGRVQPVHQPDQQQQPQEPVQVFAQQQLHPQQPQQYQPQQINVQPAEQPAIPQYPDPRVQQQQQQQQGQAPQQQQPDPRTQQVQQQPDPRQQAPAGVQPSSLSARYRDDPNCHLTVDSGTCNDFQDAWYFDTFSKKCLSFIWSGCGGNANRYKTKDECELKCGRLQPAVPARQRTSASRKNGVSVAGVVGRYSGSKSREVCNLRMDVGRCSGHFQAFYYEVATGTCQQFEYSGCGGNANRFHTKDQCENLCLRNHNVPIRIGLAGAGRVEQVPTHPGALSQNGNGGGDQQPCEHPKDTGPCNRFVTKWYFNKGDGTCNRFHYGGCEGNSNRFENEQECRNKCGDYIDTCHLPKVAGPCAGKNERFFFNTATKTCESFTFGGCLGNNNNFRTIEECEARCGGNQPQLARLTFPSSSDITVIKNRCEYPKEVGYCRAAIRMFYYNQETKKCDIFYYGGCGGNDNKFDSLDDCESYCGTKSRQQLLQALTLPANPEVYQEFQSGAGGDESYVDAEEREEGQVYDAIDEAEANEGIPSELKPNTSSEAFYFPQVKSALPELCTLPEDRGTCFGEQLSWRFDSEARSCVTFMYSGCKHNANYFTSEETCERACGKYRTTDVCRQPKESGQCHQKVSRWHFSEESNECQMFFWSGCGGNGNRFSSKAECQHLCNHEIKVQPDEKDICNLERDVGPCMDALTQWYFDKNDKECRIFTFGGCRGNENRFNNKDECTQKCQPKLQALKLHHTEICKLPFAAGHCDGNEIKWFFDSSDEECRTFSYTGCSGNENRFDSEEECVNSCRPHRRAITVTDAQVLPPKLRLVNPGPYIAGATVELKCLVETNTTEFGWFKNNTQIDDEASVNQRFVFNVKKDSLTIKNIQKEDAGKYSCAAGTIGILSQQEDIIVKDPPPKEFCLDKGTPTTCELIRKTGLCSNERYGKFCCQTCTKIGYKF